VCDFRVSGHGGGEDVFVFYSGEEGVGDAANQVHAARAHVMSHVIGDGRTVDLHQEVHCRSISTGSAFRHSSSHYLLGSQLLLLRDWVFGEALAHEAVHEGDGWPAERSFKRDIAETAFLLDKVEEVRGFVVDGGEVSVSSLTGQNQRLLVLFHHCRIKQRVSQSRARANDSPHSVFVDFQSIQGYEIFLGYE
jgi:hypothetical protein